MGGFELDPGGAKFVEFEPGRKATLRFADGMTEAGPAFDEPHAPTRDRTSDFYAVPQLASGNAYRDVAETTPVLSRNANGPGYPKVGTAADDVQTGARGPASGREFDPEAAGGPIQQLDAWKASITSEGVQEVAAHLQRFTGGGPLDEFRWAEGRRARPRSRSTVHLINSPRVTKVMHSACPANQERSGSARRPRRIVEATSVSRTTKLTPAGRQLHGRRWRRFAGW
jgi:hypothetical protein